MRDLAVLPAILLLAALLVYGGLNLAELGITGLLGCECEHEAFSIRVEPQGVLLVIFAGRSVPLHAGALGEIIKQWWDRLLDCTD